MWNNLFLAVALACFLADEIDFAEGGASSGKGVPALLLLPVISKVVVLPLAWPLVILCIASAVVGRFGRGRKTLSRLGSSRDMMDVSATGGL